MTYYYGWGPTEAWSLTYRQLQWWYQQAIRINKAKAVKNG